MTEVGAERICVALDRASCEENLELIAKLKDRAGWFKLGMRQFYAEGGARVISAIRDADARLFLDLKLHDIPKTVGDAARALERYRPDLLSVHASGGREMIRAAVEGFTSSGTGVLGVTILTSLGEEDLRRLGISGPLDMAVERLAEDALAAGARGLVCSGHEVGTLRTRFGDALLVTPGVRPRGVAAGDQKRVVTPAEAIRAGSSLLVVGRAIYRADDPRAAFDAIAADPL